MKQKVLCQKPRTVAGFRYSSKENQEKKRADETRAHVQNTSCARRSCRNLTCEQTFVVHNEPQTKARRLGLSLCANGATLVPRSLSFSLSPPHSHSMVETKRHSNITHGSHISRSFLPQTTFESQHTTSSLQGPLPRLEVFRLQPNIVAGTTVCQKASFSSHPSGYRHQLFLHCQRRSTARWRVHKT